jgi:hypothetical protein
MTVTSALSEVFRAPGRVGLRTLAQLGNARTERVEPGVGAAFAVTIAAIERIVAALVRAGADQPFYPDLSPQEALEQLPPEPLVPRQYADHPGAGGGSALAITFARHSIHSCRTS